MDGDQKCPSMFFILFDFRPGTYNVPSGSSATSLTTSAKREFRDTVNNSYAGPHYLSEDSFGKIEIELSSDDEPA